MRADAASVVSCKHAHYATWYRGDVCGDGGVDGESGGGGGGGGRRPSRARPAREKRVRRRGGGDRAAAVVVDRGYLRCVGNGCPAADGSAGGQAVQRQNCTVRARRSPVMFCCYCCATTLERTVTRPDGYCQNHGVCDSPRAGCTSTAAATRVLSRERDFGARDRRQVSFWPVLRFVRVGNARKVSLRRDFSPNAINELIRRCTFGPFEVETRQYIFLSPAGI